MATARFVRIYRGVEEEEGFAKIGLLLYISLLSLGHTYVREYTVSANVFFAVEHT